MFNRQTNKLLLLALVLFSQLSLADQITLGNGDVLHGKLIQQTDKNVVLQHPVLGKLTFVRVDLTAVGTDNTSAPVKTQAVRSSNWKKSIAVGLSGANGNSKNSNLHVDFSADYRDPDQRHLFTSQYNGKSENGSTTENNFQARLQSDFLMPDSRWFWFMREQLDWDKFEAWDYRLGFYVGPGYQFVDEKDWKLSGKLGVGGHKNWGDANEDFVPEALLGVDLEWTINDNQSLSAGNTFYPDLENDGEFRNVTLLNWKIKATDIYKGAALKLAISNEYESDVVAPIEENDFKYNLSLDIEL